MNLREIVVWLEPNDSWSHLSQRRSLVFSDFMYHEMRRNRRPCPWPKLIVHVSERPVTNPLGNDLSLSQVGELAEVYIQTPSDAFDGPEAQALDHLREVVLAALNRIRHSEYGWHDTDLERLVGTAEIDGFRFSVPQPRLSRDVRRGGPRVSTNLEVSLEGTNVVITMRDRGGKTVLEQTVANHQFPVTLREFFDARSAEIHDHKFLLKDVHGNVLARVDLSATLDTN